MEEEKEAEVKADGADRIVSVSTERDIFALIHKAARFSDDRNYLKWMELFTEDGQYSAITNENFISSGLYLYKDRGRRALHERAAFQMGLWQVPRGKTLHLVTNIVVAPGADRDRASAESNFLIMRTPELEPSRLHACGQYQDQFERCDRSWLFKSRAVIVDSNVLPPEFTELL